ncbi:MAG: endolytic transglycosylase MltG [Flavobacteriales bacterium]|nr:endolytic transglycosylase MltG [Flavobacteriales bacterium]
MKRILLGMLGLLLLGGSIVAYIFHHRIYAPNVINSKEELYLFIPTGSTSSDVVDLLKEKGLIKNVNSLVWVAERKNYTNNVHPGKYQLQPRMNNNDLIDLLRSGNQVPVTFTFNNVRFAEEIASKAGLVLEPDSAEFAAFFTDNEVIKKYGLSGATFNSIFIPNTYEFYWNTSCEAFLERMAKEYRAFWTDERKMKTKKIGLSQSEVSTLASIVESETKKNDEKPVVAGVYLNRLRKGMLLQADPTLVYATKDWEARRVLNWHKKVDSPYNTYMYKGLPPGPIRIPEPSSLDAVLNAKEHSYLYFCAKEDFSGYHNFASTYNEHLRNARKFQTALNQKGVYK